MSYKKPVFWIVLAAAAGCVVLAVCFLTDPKTKKNEEDKWYTFPDKGYTFSDEVYSALNERWTEWDKKDGSFRAKLV